MTPKAIHTLTKPRDTSGGEFSTIGDVAEQDGAYGNHIPILESKFFTLSDTVIENEGVNKKNRADYNAAIAKIKTEFRELTSP